MATSSSPKQTPAELNASLLTITPTGAPREVPAQNSATVSSTSTCTDHMVTVRWTASNGWEAPELRAYGALSLMPTAAVLHYATECFEGTKLYRGYDGKLRLFRPLRNCERMLKSSRRISLPGFQPAELEKLIKKLAAVDGPKWLPKSQPGHFLYIRPTMIGTDPAIGMKVPDEALLYVVMVMMPTVLNVASSKPVDPLTPPATPPPKTGLKLLASNPDSIRAWPGGFGHAKVGANYGPSLQAYGAAKERGFDQILWLFGEQRFVTEAGAANFFVVWRSKNELNKIEIVTAPLLDGIILEGVTRASVLDLARQTNWSKIHGTEKVDVIERKFTMQEICDADEEGRLIEAFCVGTAYFVVPVQSIQFDKLDILLSTRKVGVRTVADTIKQRMESIMYGKENHEWAVTVDDE
ncbi:putative branched-chain amino acid aminotransferase [Phaeomoniella chlamydospora]|uniref:Putative branched-chain amino acid aminotransferase n=1 Tax=Phaeomoniella chlamydospora TaxID=158046 RepID=A0A0G2E032_PHACM|nr:putative branched-chain amino acid aminotransferase [Phaeomoniella chlamydospora]